MVSLRQMSSVFIAIGSNIDAEKNMKQCAEMLRAYWPDIQFSHVYASAAMEVEEQDDFLNACASFQAEQSPEEVHHTLRAIEDTLRKAVPYRYGPRTIDLDILLFDNLVLPGENSQLTAPALPAGRQSSKLIIPHPRMHYRRFVLEPLAELMDMNSAHPITRETWSSLLAKTMDQECYQTEMVL